MNENQNTETSKKNLVEEEKRNKWSKALGGGINKLTKNLINGTAEVLKDVGKEAKDISAEVWEKIAHRCDWGEWEAVDDGPRCLETRSCRNKKCKNREERENHRWVEVSMTETNPCEKKEKCKYCDKERIVGYRHHFGEIKLRDNCKQIGICRDCGKEEELGDIHHWIIDYDENGKKIRQKCEDCKKEVVFKKWSF